MRATIECNTNQFRQSAKTLIDAMKDPSSTIPQIDNGYKCLSIMYFGLDEADPLKAHENQLLLEMIGARVVQFEVEHIVN